jgi:hypothetical protein
VSIFTHSGKLSSVLNDSMRKINLDHVYLHYFFQVVSSLLGLVLLVLKQEFQLESLMDVILTRVGSPGMQWCR